MHELLFVIVIAIYLEVTCLLLVSSDKFALHMIKHIICRIFQINNVKLFTDKRLH